MKIFDKLIQKNANIKDVGNVTALFLGDSVTHGAFQLINENSEELKHVFDYDAVYHNQLKMMLAKICPLAPLNIINSGIAGTSASFGLKRFDRDVLPYSPDFAVVCFGLNDAGAGMGEIDVYTDALRCIFNKLKDANVETVFMTPNMMNTYTLPIKNETFQMVAKATEETQNSGVMDAYMAGARKVCKELDVPVCDCYKKWKQMQKDGIDTTELLANHINHPNREMHKLFAQSLYEMIIR